MRVRRPRIVQLHRVRPAGPLYRQNPYSALSSSGSPVSPPGPPRDEPAGNARPRKPCRMDLPTLPDPFPEQLTHGRQKRHPCSFNFILQHQFHASGGWVLNPVPWITTANEHTRKVRLPNNQIADRLLPLKWERKTTSPTDWTWPFQGLHRLFGTPGLDFLAGWCR